MASRGPSDGLRRSAQFKGWQMLLQETKLLWYSTITNVFLSTLWILPTWCTWIHSENSIASYHRERQRKIKTIHSSLDHSTANAQFTHWDLLQKRQEILYTLHNAVHSPYQCGLSYQNVIWFHSTHMTVISVNSTWKYGLHCADLHKLKIIQWTAVNISYW